MRIGNESHSGRPDRIRICLHQQPSLPRLIDVTHEKHSSRTRTRTLIFDERADVLEQRFLFAYMCAVISVVPNAMIHQKINTDHFGYAVKWGPRFVDRLLQQKRTKSQLRETSTLGEDRLRPEQSTLRLFCAEEAPRSPTMEHN